MCCFESNCFACWPRSSCCIFWDFLAWVVGTILSAQEPGNVPETKAPAPTQAAAKHPDNDYWRKHDQQLLTDFPWLERFKEADLKLGPPAAGEKRVVFMGDSITEGWHFDAPGGVFAAKPYINRGISGQTTPQMVLRFHQDVIALQPKVVVILAGTNDIAGNTGPMTLEETENNLAAMAEMATANHIGVVLCSILPAFDYPWQPGLTPAPKIDADQCVDQELCRGARGRVCRLSLGDEGRSGRITRKFES